MRGGGMKAVKIPEATAYMPMVMAFSLMASGAAAASGEYLVFLNNDTIPLKGWLGALVEEVCTHADVAIVGGKLLFEDRTVQHAGVAIDRLNMTPYHIYRGFSEDHPAVNKRLELNAVTAACVATNPFPSSWTNRNRSAFCRASRSISRTPKKKMASK